MGLIYMSLHTRSYILSYVGPVLPPLPTMAPTRCPAFRGLCSLASPSLSSLACLGSSSHPPLWPGLCACWSLPREAPTPPPCLHLTRPSGASTVSRRPSPTPLLPFAPAQLTLLPAPTAACLGAFEDRACVFSLYLPLKENGLNLTLLLWE